MASDPGARQGCGGSPALQKAEQSSAFQGVVITMIFLNTLLMSLEADYPANTDTWAVYNNVFLVFFLCELTFRLAAYGCSFFCNQDKAWNIFDFLIVLVGVVDQWVVAMLLSPDQATGKMSKFIMIFRILRILRVLRAFRLFRQFKKLNILAKGLIDSTQSVAWIALLFLLVMFVYSIVITNLAGQNTQMFENEEEKEIVQEKFGSILRSMETLFIFLTCDDWSTPARIINKKMPYMQLVWVTYIVLAAFTLLSLLTGLMADKMNQTRTAEEEAETKAKASKVEELSQELKVIFDKADTSGDARVDPKEFEAMLLDEEVTSRLQECGVPALEQAEIRKIFDAFDRDLNGELEWDEFRDGLVQLTQPSTIKDVMWLEGLLVKLDRSLKSSGLERPGIRWDQKVERVHARASLISERLTLLEKELQEVFASAGYSYGHH